jgi:hypothetical protein
LSPVPVALLRAAWFMENATRDVEAEHRTGRIPLEAVLKDLAAQG